jgi:hypothetical protein
MSPANDPDLVPTLAVALLKMGGSGVSIDQAALALGNAIKRAPCSTPGHSGEKRY